MYTKALARAFPRTGLSVDAVVSKGDGMQKLADCVPSLLALCIGSFPVFVSCGSAALF